MHVPNEPNFPFLVILDDQKNYTTTKVKIFYLKKKKKKQTNKHIQVRENEILTQSHTINFT